MNIPRSTLTRRKFIVASVAGAAAAAIGAPGSFPKNPDFPDDHALSSFDREMESFMTARNIPGGALAVVKDEKLVYTRGYGWADREKKLPATPVSLFRIASLSKPITATVIMQLVQQAKLSLDDKVLDFISVKPLLGAGRKMDDRWKRITLRQCLQHTGGWDRDASFDPMFRPVEFARSLGKPAPASPEDVIRNMLGMPLDFDPGTRYAYSNFGYCLLGRVIEKVTGTSYEQHVKQSLLRPLGITRMRIGATLEGKEAAGEVRYYMPEPVRTVASVFDQAPGKVASPYGGFHLEAMDSHGGWIASAVDLVRLSAALDDAGGKFPLTPSSSKAVAEPPPAPVARDKAGKLKDSYYGLGWQVRPIQGRAGKANLWHTGSLPGTRTLWVRRWDGYSWAVLFNQRQDIPNLPDGEIDPAMHRATSAVKRWPQENLFSKYQ